ncbi:uncharacterized protein LOC126669682 [Mercurialis annua]|uniref:uncharacterized protein LOC126669682 n=1 Tax=Mercurialis annua TaxID=3986 RepID=UPI002160B24E|nr:uncharacterized protein LOC126669682 [Mercurialis annua]
MIYRRIHKFLVGSNYYHLSEINGAVPLHLMFCCHYHSHGEALPLKWYEKAYPTIVKLTHELQNVDLIDGRMVNVNDGSVVMDDCVAEKMHALKSLARVFIGSPVVQRNLRESMKPLSANPVDCFRELSEREPIVVNSLTKISNFLNVSAQQRKVVRHTICPQVTQHRIWTGALKETLNGLKSDMDSLCYKHSGKENDNIAQQIVSSCLKFLADVDNSEHGCTSWTRIRTSKSVESHCSGKWEDLLEMFNDLIRCLASKQELLYHFGKLEVMKEGLSQIKDLLVDKGIGFKEVRYQEGLVQKQLSKTLGHSSRCLFTLLSYYLYGYVRDIEIDLCGGIYGGGDGTQFCLCMGRILTLDEENMVRSGLKQLDRALGLYKFIWETSGMKGVLELQGHLWCVGAKERTLTYKGNLFFVHGISL